MHLGAVLHLSLLLSAALTVAQAGPPGVGKSSKICKMKGGKCMYIQACEGKVIKNAKCRRKEICCASKNGTDVVTVTETDVVALSPAELCLVDNTTGIDDSSQAPVIFAIKSWSSGIYIQTKDHNNNCGAELAVFAALTDNAHFELVIHEQSQWAYIRHVQSGHYVIPRGDLYDPPSETPLVLSANKRPCGLFELDQVTKHIRHISGLYVHIQGMDAYPPDNRIIHLFAGVSMPYNTEWVFVNPANPDKEVPPYGNATINGDWRLFFSVDKPLAAQTYTVEVTLGYSKTESVTSDFKFAWEVTANVRKLFYEMSAKASVALEIQHASSETWSSETKLTNQINVNVNEPVAVWQKIFVGEQCRHRSVYQSDIYAHTDSSLKPPGKNYTALNFQLT